MAKIKIIKDKYKDNPEKYSIEHIVGEIFETKDIDDDGVAIVKDKEDSLTDVFPDEYKIIKLIHTC